MAQSISQEAIGATGLPGATAASRHAGATTSGAPTSGTFAVGDFIVDQSGSTWICTASSQTASATTASGNGNLITFTASNSFSPGQYVNVTGFSNTGYNVSNAVIGSASSTQFTVVSSATGTTTGTGTAVTTGTWQLSGVPVNENIAGKNFVINGGMDIWQRGTSFVIPASTFTYAADRWCTYCATASVQTVSQISSGLTGFQYAMRSQRTSGSTSTSSQYVTQSIETKNSLPVTGQTVTWSFWARAGANYSATSNLLTVQLTTGTGTDQNALNGFTGASNVINTGATLTTSWQKFFYTTTIASTVTQLAVSFIEIPTGTAGANDYFDITGVQLEIAPQATLFSRAGGSIGGELALCQRYYVSLNTSNFYVYGNFWNSANGLLFTALPSTMRATPTVGLPASFGSMVAVVGLSNFTPSSPSASATTNSFTFNFFGGSAGYSAGQPILLNTGFVFTVSAEL